MRDWLPYIIGFSLVFMLSLIYLKYKMKKISIRLWQRSLNLMNHAPVFNQIYADSNGFLLSKQARQQQDAPEYTYGEIEFLSFIALLSLSNPNNNTVFYDLGSGTGKAVLSCAMVFPVQEAVGVELFPELYSDACNRLSQLAAMDNYADQAKKIHFVLGDFLEVNLDKATMIFINSTAFFGTTWEKLCSKLNNLPQLDTIITTSKSLSCAYFALSKRTQVEMSWGIVFAYIHIRKTTSTKPIEIIE